MTITSGQANRRITQLHTTLRYLAAHTPIAIAHINTEINTHDGYPSGANEITVATTRSSSIVEQAAGHLLPLTDELADIDYHLDQAERHIQHLVRATQRRSPAITDDDKRRMRCTGGGDQPGAIEWGDSACTEWADAGGLGPACRMRRMRWQRNQHDQVG